MFGREAHVRSRGDGENVYRVSVSVQYTKGPQRRRECVGAQVLRQLYDKMYGDM